MHVVPKLVNQADRPRRALLVDDSIGMRIYLKAILSAVGFTCTEAQDGSDAFDLILRTDFDLVVTDIDMPRMDGMELLAAIQLLPTGRKRPGVIVCSARLDEDRKERHAQLKLAGALLHKPVSAEALVQAVDRVLA